MRRRFWRHSGWRRWWNEEAEEAEDAEEDVAGRVDTHTPQLDSDCSQDTSQWSTEQRESECSLTPSRQDYLYSPIARLGRLHIAPTCSQLPRRSRHRPWPRTPPPDPATNPRTSAAG